jgi:hypothetical protein
MLPAKLIDLTGQLQIHLLPATAAAEAQARVSIMQQGQVTAQCLIPATQLDAIVQSWQQARIEFPGKAWITPINPLPGSPVLLPIAVLLQQLQSMAAIAAMLGDTSAAENYCEDCRIEGNIVGNHQYQTAFWYCNAAEHLGLAIGYLSKVLDLED